MTGGEGDGGPDGRGRLRFVVAGALEAVGPGGVAFCILLEVAGGSHPSVDEPGNRGKLGDEFMTTNELVLGALEAFALVVGFRAPP